MTTTMKLSHQMEQALADLTHPAVQGFCDIRSGDALARRGLATRHDFRFALTGPGLTECKTRQLGTFSVAVATSPAPQLHCINGGLNA